MPPWRSLQARGLAWLGLVLLTVSVSVFALTAAFERSRSHLPSSSLALDLNHPGSAPAPSGELIVEPVDGAWSPSGSDWVSTGTGTIAASTRYADYHLRVILEPVTAGQTLAGVEVLFRRVDARSYYAIAFQADGWIVLSRVREGAQERLAWVRWTEPGQAPLDVDLEARSASLSVSMNGLRLFEYEDPDPLLSGGAAVVSAGPAIRVSGVSVEALGERGRDD
jgi:hypothetical protein